MIKTPIYLVHPQTDGHARTSDESFAQALETCGYERVSRQCYVKTQRRAQRHDTKVARRQK